MLHDESKHERLLLIIGLKMNRKKVLLVSIAVIASSFSTISAAQDGSLNFTFQGIIPPAAVTPGSWKFTDLSGTDYIPLAIPLSTSRNNDSSYTLSMINPEVFAIQTTTKGANFTENSNIKAQLASLIINGSALNASGSGNNNATAAVSINGVALSDISQNVATATGNSTVLSMNARVDLPADSVKNIGGNVSMTSAVIFSADIASVTAP